MEGFYKRNMYNCVNIIIIVDYGIRIQIIFFEEKKYQISKFLCQFLLNVMIVVILEQKNKIFWIFSGFECII